MLYPAEKSNELIAAINSLVESGPNDLKIASIRRDAVKLENSGKFVESRHLLGLLAAFQGNTEEVDRCFNAAEAASGYDVLITVNHAVALSNMRRYRKALTVIDRALERTPDDICFLVQAANMHLEAYDVDGTRAMIDRLHRLGKDIEQENPMIQEQLAAKSGILAGNNVSWDEVAARIELAVGVLGERGFAPMSCPIVETLGEDAMLYEFHLNTDAEGAAAAEDAIVEAICNQPYSRVDNAIVFYCVAA